FAFWQTTFALGVIIYALWKDAAKPVNRSGRSTKVEIGVTIACVVIVTGILAWVATAGVEYLPHLHNDPSQRTSFGFDVSVSVLLLIVMTLAVLFVRRYTVLDQWLMVTLVAWLPNRVLATFFDGRQF